MAGLILAVVFWVQARQVRSLSYGVLPERAIVFDPATSKDLLVSFRGRNISGQVYAAQIWIWNSGTLTIRMSDVLQDVSVTLAESVKPLEFKVTRLTRPLIELRPNTKLSTQNKIYLAWKILEPGDGAICQLIYEGGPNDSITVTGALEGQNQIAKYRMPPPRSATGAGVAAVVCLGLGVVTLMISVIGLIKTFRINKVGAIGNCAFFIAMSTVFFILGGAALIAMIGRPPF